MPDTAMNDAAPESAVQAAWHRYLAMLDDMRVKIEAAPQFVAHPDQRGMAYRHLMEVQAMTYNFVVAPRTAHPRLFRNTAWQTEFYSIGGNGPDFDYRTLFLDGQHTYRLSGRFNDSRNVFAQLNNKTAGLEGSRNIASLDFRDFQYASDGSFSVILSADRHDGNWIELLRDADYQWMMFRPTVETWDEVAAELTIERISPIPDGSCDSDEYSEAVIARRIDAAAAFARYVLTDWTIGYVPLVLRSAGETNKFAVFSTEDAGELGSPVAQYLQCVFEVERDEALILEFDEEPNGAYWSLQLYDVWQHSLGLRTRQTTLNGRQMSKDKDGAVRIVLSYRDPGVVNWLDNAGYTRGEVTWRNYKVTKNVPHRIHRMKFEKIAAHLPPETPRISPEQRAAELVRRREAYLRRHGE